MTGVFPPESSPSERGSLRAVVSTDASAAAAVIRSGQLAAFPTETVYGLGGNALSTEAVARIFAAKDRPRFDPLIVHAADAQSALGLASDVPQIARELADRFWPGPLTLLLPKRDIVPDLVTSGLPSVGLRVPDHPFALAMLRETGCPVAAPSANPFGRVSPTTAAHVVDQLGDRIDFILDGGPCRVGIESTVLRIGHGTERPCLLRHGGVTIEELEEMLGPVDTATQSDSDLAPQLSPGSLLQHYSPRTPLHLLPHWQTTVPDGLRLGALAFQRPVDADRFSVIETLSPTGDLVEATARFFAALRRLDDADVDLIVAVPFPNHGLGRALNDRLTRAAHTS